VKFTSYFEKVEVLEESRNLAETNRRFEQGYGLETRRIRRGLIPYIKNARR
jgi:hypothetical protein